ncbi:MAG TPA: hypothetical protein VI451_21355 [Anaerolineales bacterium]|nr:hypothetical protein [Anaerolineales bacterium]
MNHIRKPVYFVLFCAIVLLIWPALKSIWGSTSPDVSAQGFQCTQLFKPGDLPSPVLINFDDLPNAAVIGTHYRPSFGVTFEDGDVTQAITYGNEPGKAQSPPNVASNNAIFPNSSNNVPMNIWFDEPKSHVGFYIGNGENQDLRAAISAYDVSGALVCEFFYSPVPEADMAFVGMYDPNGSIFQVKLDYGDTGVSEVIDDLYFSPRAGIPPTRTPDPTWTPVPSATPTEGPTPTATPLIPMFPYLPPVLDILLPPFLFNYDLSLHGIEITQGIQCFNPSQGLASCPDNSLPVIAKKDATARTYIKISGIFSSMSNVPIRLYIRANGVWYQANANGKATTTINQANSDSANIYFNVNFTNDVVVDFYAEVDPDNLYTETNETNNRFPASGYITLTFHKRDTLDIVGQRLYYHPSGYSGDQYAGGWAVNGGAADWFEQMLPIRNNGIDYSVKSGYLNWTSSLGSGDNQHALIQTLNLYWILENAFGWLFTGASTGADHVYGWAPNDGYSGGHADMPVYPHASGLGVVGIGTDNPGANTDNPGSGALIFGHELTHDYNIYHTNTADACGSNDGNSDFPYGNSSIQEFGFNPYTGKIYNPSNTHDLMSYCPSGGGKQGWISPFTWNRMYNNLSTTGEAIYQKSERWGSYFTFVPTGASESLVVNATIFNPANTPPVPGALGDLYRIETGTSYLPAPGDYAIELWNIDGGVVYSKTFEVNFESEYDAHTGIPFGPDEAPPFPPDPTNQVDVSFIIPWIPGTVQIALTYQGQPLDVRAVSGNPPQVLITNPIGAESWLPGSTHTLMWQGLDLDNDPLTYTLLYSHDGGANWILLQGDLTDSSYDVQTDSLAGGSDVRFRVVATDGVNTALDETDQAITVPNQAPQATILNPGNNSFHSPGSLIVMQGYGTDMEDGSLPDESLTWSSDVQGSLGIGPSLPINTLDPGIHVITLTVTDSYGISSSVSVTITIGYPIYLPVIVP